MRSRAVVVATEDDVFTVDAASGTMKPAQGLGTHSASCLAADAQGPLWLGSEEGGIFRSEDRGASWRAAGLDGERVTAIAVSPTARDVIWAGTEPSEIWRSLDAGRAWERTRGLNDLPSSAEWSFPPKPDTHHVRWIACHPRDPGRLFVAIEAGALVTTPDGARTWRDRVPGGPYDTHELAIHPAAPDRLRVAAGDGYFESADGGATWTRPRDGLDVGYMRSVAIDPGDPDVVIVSGASHPFAAYRAGSADGRLYRREGSGPWRRVSDGWPDPPSTVAPVLVAGASGHELWAADERGVHLSETGGASWRRVAAFPSPPRSVWALALA